MEFPKYWPVYGTCLEPLAKAIFTIEDQAHVDRRLVISRVRPDIVEMWDVEDNDVRVVTFGWLRHLIRRGRYEIVDKIRTGQFFLPEQYIETTGIDLKRDPNVETMVTVGQYKIVQYTLVTYGPGNRNYGDTSYGVIRAGGMRKYMRVIEEGEPLEDILP